MGAATKGRERLDLRGPTRCEGEERQRSRSVKMLALRPLSLLSPGLCQGRQGADSSRWTGQPPSSVLPLLHPGDGNDGHAAPTDGPSDASNAVVTW